METQSAQRVRRLVLVLDAAVLVGALFVARALHGALKGVVPQIRELATSEQLYLLPFAVIPLFLLFISALGLHSLDRAWTRRQLASQLFKLHGVGFLTLTILVFVTQTVVNRSLAILYLSCTFVLLYAERAVLLRWRRHLHREGGGQRRILLVGDLGHEVSHWISTAQASDLPPQFVGVLTGAIEGTSGSPAILGKPEALPQVLHQNVVDEVVFVPPLNRPEEVAALVDACETLGVPATFWVEMPRPAVAVPRVDSRHGQPVITFELAPKPPDALAVKHAFDVLAAAVLIILVAPVMIITALLILITMGRPVFFTQERAGLYGRIFWMRKFRTMISDAEAQKDALSQQNEMSGPVFKMRNDPRITRLGRLLRRMSIDELPQLFHVLAGTMSLVGPRPLPVREQAQMKGWHRRRLSMRPGLTGLWQVSGRSDLDFETWMKLDLEYVDRWSLGMDLKILLKTIPTVLLGRGAR